MSVGKFVRRKIWPSKNVVVGKFVVGKYVSENLVSENMCRKIRCRKIFCRKNLRIPLTIGDVNSYWVACYVQNMITTINWFETVIYYNTVSVIIGLKCFLIATKNWAPQSSPITSLSICRYVLIGVTIESQLRYNCVSFEAETGAVTIHLNCNFGHRYFSQRVLWKTRASSHDGDQLRSPLKPLGIPL